MSSEIKFQRFPRVNLRGLDLIWDTRQEPLGGPERVYVSPHLNDDLKNQLRIRGQKKLCECVEGSDVLHALGKDISLALNYPSRSLYVVGVTGTNGKTSTVEALAWLYSSLGKTVMQVGTLGISLWQKDLSGFGKKLWTVESGFTTPEAPSLHQLMKDALDLNVEVFLMEVSSHALDLGRVSGIDFDAALFTNLSQDHLDFHKTMQDYSLAKQKLFTDSLKTSVKSNKVALMAAPDAYSLDFTTRVSGLLHDIPSLVLQNGMNLEVIHNGIDILKFKFEDVVYESKLLGAHNVWNLSLSLALLKSNGFSEIDLQKLLPKFNGPVGRLERVAGNCFVDYAHTPDALENVLKSMKSFCGQGSRIFCVMGCGGNRDQSKRPLMGNIAAQWADQVWVTNDNPRFEEPILIANQIMAGVPDSKKNKVKILLDRAEAIAEAVHSLNRNDVLLVAGKGHETYQIIGDHVKAFSDQDEIRKNQVLS